MENLKLVVDLFILNPGSLPPKIILLKQVLVMQEDSREVSMTQEELHGVGVST